MMVVGIITYEDSEAQHNLRKASCLSNAYVGLQFSIFPVGTAVGEQEAEKGAYSIL